MERPLRISLLTAAVLTSAGFGCAAPIAADVDAGSSQKLSVVEVRAWHAADTGALSRVDASARFVSVREPGSPVDALELLGLGWKSVAPGTCTLVDDTGSTASSPVRVDLRDLSPVTLLLEGAPVGLEPRAFPDVAGLVSGVVFVAPAELNAPESTHSVSLQTATGTFSGLELPELPSPLRLLDATANDGTFTVDARGLDLATATPHGDDRTLVEIVRSGRVRARCGVDASGRLHVDANALGGAGDATLVVRAQRHLLRDEPGGSLDARLERDVEVRLSIR